jgi:hypothetical protein
MIIYSKEYDSNKARNIYWSNIDIIDYIPNDVWVELDKYSLEYYAIWLLDRYFSGCGRRDLVGIYKTKLPMFDKTTWGLSADVFLVRYRNNGTTNLISYSLDAINWLKQMNDDKGCTRSVSEDDFFVRYFPKILD